MQSLQITSLSFVFKKSASTCIVNLNYLGMYLHTTERITRERKLERGLADPNTVSCTVICGLSVGNIYNLHLSLLMENSFFVLSIDFPFFVIEDNCHYP